MTERNRTLAGRGRRIVQAIVLVVGAATLVAPAPAVAEDVDYLYVASQSGPAVTVIDTSTLEVVATIDLVDLGYSPTAKPHHTAVEPDGSHWYVSLISDGRVLKFDRQNQLVGETDFETPGMLSIDPDSDRLYVGRSMAAVNPPQRIGMIERSTMALDEVDVFFPRPHAIVAAGNGLVYSASLAENRMAALEPAEEGLELIDVPGHHGMDMAHTLVQFALSLDGKTLVVGGEMTGQVLVFDRADPLAPELVETLEVGAKPWHPTFSADGSKLYFPLNLGNGVAVIDTGRWEVVETIEHPALVEPHGSALSPDGRVLFVAGRNTDGSYDAGNWHDGSPMGTVVAIDTSTHEVIKVLHVPPYAAGISTRNR